MQRFFLTPETFRTDTLLITDSEKVHQMRRVLRMRAGDSFMALDNLGNEFECVIEEIGEKEVRAHTLQRSQNTAEPEIFITLYQALPKKRELFEWVLQKGTEVGVSAFVPLITKRTERSEPGNRKRLETILREAAEQCERGKIPLLHEPMHFEDAVKKADGVKIVLHGRDGHSQFKNELVKIKDAKKVSIFVGPEGGLTEEETNSAESQVCAVCSLGPRVLRTETAGIAAVSVIFYG